MADEHIFVASGDACAICVALNGQVVPAGYTAHESCMCSTIPKEGDRHCEHQVSEIDFQTLPSGNILASFEVTVTCPGGGEAGASGFVEAEPGTQNPIQELWEAVAELADEICESCADEAEAPFNCC